MKTLLLILILSLGCGTPKEAIQVNEVWVTFVRQEVEKRYRGNHWDELPVFIYVDEHSTEYRVKTYEGLVMKIHVTSRN